MNDYITERESLPLNYFKDRTEYGTKCDNSKDSKYERS